MDQDAPAEIVVALLVERGRMLLCHRSPARRWYPDVWDLPGGHIEDGETPGQALVRELAEELGITAAEPTGPPVAVVETAGLHLRIWLITSWTGVPVNAAPEEHDQLLWADLARTRDLDFAHPAYAALFADVLGGP